MVVAAVAVNAGSRSPGHAECVKARWSLLHLVGVPKCSHSKYGCRASGVRTRAGGDLRKPVFYLVFCVPYQSAQVRRSGENWPSESDFRASPRRASQQVCPENPRKPATQRGARSGREHGSYENWRGGCCRVLTVSGSRSVRGSVPPVRRPALVLHARARHRTKAGATLSGIEREPAMRRSPPSLALTERTK